ncbi:AAA domain-containing protein [Corynebacterium cystitidis]|uniref:AAA domain-containing protein n=1 Tax=Corynebacterium cystitidis TaxID=35757 RepID=UPI00211EF7AC|nr:AAA domain-containing protein [Corynebacterium cystitidis]
MGFLDFLRKLWKSMFEGEIPENVESPELVDVPEPNEPPIQVDQVSHYFRRVLERSELQEVDFSDPSFVKIRKSDLETAELDCETTCLLYRLAGRPLDERPIEGSREDLAEKPDATRPKPLDIIISAVTLFETPGNSPTVSGPGKGLVLLAGQLTSEGLLSFELNRGVNPWIPSERLRTPTGIDHPVMVGDLSRFGAFSVGDIHSRIAELDTPLKALELAEDMFEFVSESDLKAFKNEAEKRNYTVDVDHYYVLPHARIVASGAIQKLYSRLSSNDDSVLYTRMIRGWETPKTRADTLSSPSVFLDSALRSCGNMSDGFPLTPSQRAALHATLRSDSGDITAVSGPPGTGKTTLLQAVVANLITQRALDEAAPPLIVGTSTNNQAVTNIIESFASVTKTDFGPLDHRWLPTADLDDTPLQGLAVFCPSVARIKNAKKKYLVEQTRKEHTYSEYSRPFYIAMAIDYYLKRASKFFPDATTVKQAQLQMHMSLKNVDRIRSALLKAMANTSGRTLERELHSLVAELKNLPFFQDDQRVDQIASCSSLADLDKLLDITVRYVEFWLAVHYFEAQWLELGENEEFIPEEDRWKNDSHVMENYWNQAPLITPCFVMTCYQVPRYFQLYTPSNSRDEYAFGRIDLLIVDEAGQVDSPVGLANFSLAKRALVVGDEKQLSPVWSLDGVTDCAEAKWFDISEDAWRTQLTPRGLTGSHPSSLMKAAATASKYTYGETGKEQHGLFLAEHFRCHPRIIGYCNELLYDDSLEPKRLPEDSKLDQVSEPFIFQEIPGSTDNRSGVSRENCTEAVAIARWILNNFGKYFEIYDEHVDDPNKRVSPEKLVGVVTPFSAQAKLIKKVIKSESLRRDDPNLPDEIWKKITVGTAHALQGAERPIVLFSPTYGENSPQSGFIDSNLELINVAVSRAKDMFVVFGAKNRWDNGEAFEVMSKYAKRQAYLSGPEAQSLLQEEDNSFLGEPRADEEEAISQAPPISATRLIKRWKAEGILTAADSSINAMEFNKRLYATGFLTGRPGAWTATPKAKSVGVVETSELDHAGQQYVAIKYTGEAQELLKILYLVGKL